MTALPDARKSLNDLRKEWLFCSACELGQHRLAIEGEFVFGRGQRGGVMLVGEGPGKDEELEGSPFVGRTGTFLQKVLTKLHLQDTYFTNVVACRSCSAVLDDNGHPLFRKDYKRQGQMLPVFRDEPPTSKQCETCRPRLYEEIYLVDPVIIVGLGNKACEALLKHPITITSDRGQAQDITIPGATFSPTLTDKKQQWLRKTPRGYEAPVEQNEVAYHFMPTLHPAYVLRLIGDRGADSPFRKFVDDLRQVRTTYESYLELMFGKTPALIQEDGTDEELHERLAAEDRE